MDTLKQANALREEMSGIRRHLHENAEVGYKLPKTVAYVKQKLTEMGYDPQDVCEGGVSATIGSGGKVLLLRADMDALPIKEESGEGFACPNGAMHACGHDMHTTILLATAKMLKERESELKGTIKLMFQPAEEIFWGARAMIEGGVMENPKVDAAFALHVGTPMECGSVNYRRGAAMSAVAGFKIDIKGKGSHGAQPENGVDPINIAVHIHLALQALIARETPLTNGALLTIGQLVGGTAANIIPDTAVMQGTIRTFNEDTRQFMIERMKTVVTETAKMFRGEASIEMLSDVPVMENNLAFTDDMLKYMKEIPGLNINAQEAPPMGGSEDFALLGQLVPAFMFFMGANPADESKVFPMHHPKIQLNEDCLPIGATIMTGCAVRWLEENA